MSKMSDALELARQVKGYSARKIADLAKDAGYSLSNKTVSQYLNGHHGSRPDPATLEAFSHVLGIKVNVLRDLAKLPPVIEEYEPPAEASALTPNQRRLVDDLIRELASANYAESDDEEAPPNLVDLNRRQREADETPVEEIEKMAAYRPKDGDNE